MASYNEETRKKIVRLHLEEGRSLKSLSEEFPYRNPESQTGSKNTVKNARQTPTQNKNMT